MYQSCPAHSSERAQNDLEDEAVNALLDASSSREDSMETEPVCMMMVGCAHTGQNGLPLNKVAQENGTTGLKRS